MAIAIGQGVERDFGLIDGVNADLSPGSDSIADRMMTHLQGNVVRTSTLDREGLIRSLAEWGEDMASDDNGHLGSLVITTANNCPT